MNQFTPQPDSTLICTVQVCPSVPIISSDSPGGHYSLILSVISITRYLLSFYYVVLTIVTFLVTTPVALFGGSNCASAGGILCDIIFSWKLANERDQRNFRITILGAVSQGDSSIWRILGEHHYFYYLEGWYLDLSINSGTGVLKRVIPRGCDTYKTLEYMVTLNIGWSNYQWLLIFI